MPEPNSGCFLWIGSDGRSGYGSLRYEGRSQRAHRLAWIAKNGPIPAGMYVCHKCDVRSCVNIDHLFLGTHGDNMRDAFAKGRISRAKGEASACCRITDANVMHVAADTRKQREIAATFGISRALVSMIKNGYRRPK